MLNQQGDQKAHVPPHLLGATQTSLIDPSTLSLTPWDPDEGSTWPLKLNLAGGHL